MKKLITLGSAAMIGMTLLGTFQGVTQATENHEDSLAGMVSILGKEMLGTTVHADDVVEDQLAVTYTLENQWVNPVGTRKHVLSVYNNKIHVNTNGGYIAGIYKVTVTKTDGTSNVYLLDKQNDKDICKLDEGDKIKIQVSGKAKIQPMQVSEGYNITQNITMDKPVFLEVEDGKITDSDDAQPDQKGQTNVEYTHTETPGEPGWYGIIPANIIFNDDNKEEALDAKVKLVNADDKNTAYTGSKTVGVTVKSTNGFKLQDGAKKAVDYALTNKAGEELEKDKTEQDLGILAKNDTEIHSKANLKGEAEESGKFVDVLNYRFSEQ